MSEMSDDLLVSRWVQAMHASFTTQHPSWKAEVATLLAEIHRRGLGLKCLKVKIAEGQDDAWPPLRSVHLKPGTELSVRIRL